MSIRPVCRLGDMCTGHDGYKPRGNNQGSPNVFINGIPVHRKGDSWPKHDKGKSGHGSVLGSGSKTVFANGKEIGRIGDPVACGSLIAQGSSNVFSG